MYLNEPVTWGSCKKKTTFSFLSAFSVYQTIGVKYLTKIWTEPYFQALKNYLHENVFSGYLKYVIFNSVFFYSFIFSEAHENYYHV